MKHWRRVAAVILGGATVLSFAPFNWVFMPLISLAVWVILIEQASSWRSAVIVGLCWGFGFFGLGVQWVYTTVHTVGGMPWALGLIMHALFAMYLSFYPACVAGIMKALLKWYGDKRPSLKKGEHSFLLWSLIFPVLWVASEWLRGEGYLGFNWLTLGYSQAGVTPIAGWARLIGVYGVSFWLVALAGALGVLCLRVDHIKWHVAFTQWLAVLLVIMASGKWGLVYAWTSFDQKMDVSLIQGNVAQENKWNEQWQYDIFKRYTRLLNEAQGKVVIIPETALPVLRDQLPQQWVSELSEVYTSAGRTVLLGLVDQVKGRSQYYNSIWVYGKYADQAYHKRHLVPFGEFIPGIQWLGFLERWWAMPLSAFKRGIDDPLILKLDEITLAPSICYEDGFSRLFRGKALEATVLLNISNDAWFGSGVAIDQHLQIAQMRSIESAKFMVRSNNTAGTAIIDDKGNIRQKLPPFKESILEGEVMGYRGVTPFMRYGEVVVLVLCGLSLIVAWGIAMLWSKN